ncbi:CopG family transcriptional regulator [Corynebacterium halotolerans]|nr:CopG family transcriptional regulator [Corynebacterium halotolerans]
MYNIKLPVELHRRAKMQAFKEDRTMKDIIVELLRDYLDEHEE